MIKILVLILLGIVIGWYIPKPAIVDTTINKIKDMLDNHVGIDRQTCRKLKKLNSRYITIFRHYPQSYLSENSVGLLNEDSDDEG